LSEAEANLSSALARSDELSCSGSLTSLSSRQETPRSEREAEDAAAHYEALALARGEENEKLRERVKKERAKRAKDKDKYKFLLEQKDVKYAGLEALLQQEKAGRLELEKTLEKRDEERRRSRER
jgi:hypothetical protein